MEPAFHVVSLPPDRDKDLFALVSLLEEVFFRRGDPWINISLLGETLLECVESSLTDQEVLNPMRDSEFLTLSVTFVSLKVVLSSMRLVPDFAETTGMVSIGPMSV